MQVSGSIGLGAKGRLIVSNKIPEDASAVRTRPFYPYYLKCNVESGAALLKPWTV